MIRFLAWDSIRPNVPLEIFDFLGASLGVTSLTFSASDLGIGSIDSILYSFLGPLIFENLEFKDSILANISVVLSISDPFASEVMGSRIEDSISDKWQFRPILTTGRLGGGEFELFDHFL